MSCDGNDSFGYVKIEDDMVVAYTGESNNPTVHKFCNEEFVQAVKLQELLKNRIEEIDKDNDCSHMGKYEEICRECHPKWDVYCEMKKLLEESKK